MMISMLFARVWLLASVSFAPVAADFSQWMNPAAPAAAQSAEVSTSKFDPDGIVAKISQSTIAKLFKGEKKLSPEDLGHLEFWIGLIKEPLIAGISFVPRLFVAAVFLLFFWVLNRAMRRLIVGSLSKANVDPSIRDMLGHLIKWTVMGFGLVIAFNQIGIQITALLTGVSIVGLAMGLAAQETLANFIAGIVIFWDKPFRIGDIIEIEGAAGTVQRVTFRSTRMLDGDGQIIVLPNTFVLAHKLSNHTAHALRRVNVPVGIAYKESIDAAREVMLELAANDSRICPDPPPAVSVIACAESSVDLMLRFWISEKGIATTMRCEYIEKVKKAFDEAGIEIPFPHVQLLVDRPAAHELRAAG
ncbi:MAG TPA: mechanosensitive ion channel [Tepidisphaeraceae bacterium]|nr:mechanosensitive ion channel [Tepidisphaeraceae bacterium]